jgi:hypothetical protein
MASVLATTVPCDVSNAAPVTRQIGDHKWQFAEEYMEENPALQEVTVAKHYPSGTVFTLRRKPDGTFERITTCTGPWSLKDD